MSTEKKTRPHPIVEIALELVHEGFEPIEFDEYAIEQLEDELKKYFGKPELLNAVVNLINLAAVLDDHGSHKASLQIIIVTSTAADELKKISELKKTKL